MVLVVAMAATWLPTTVVAGSKAEVQAMLKALSQ